MLMSRFYDGGRREMSILQKTYEKLAAQIHAVFKVRIPYGMTEDFVIKYFWSAVGYGLMSIPVFFPTARHPLPVKASTGAASQEEHHDDIASRTESESFVII